MAKKGTAAARKALRSRRLSEAAKRAIASGDTEAVAAEYEVSHSSLINYMKSGDHMDMLRQAQVERTSLKVQRAAAMKGDLALQLAASIEKNLNDLNDAFFEADEKEKMAKVIGLLMDKYLAVLGDPSFIMAAQIGISDGTPGTDHTAHLERLAKRAGVVLPGMREIEQPIEDAEIVDDDDDDAPEPEDDPEWDEIEFG